MQSEKHFNTAVSIYILILIIVVIMDVLAEVKIIDIIYFAVLVCCVLKVWVILKD